jgi:hypothetical protein
MSFSRATAFCVSELVGSGEDRISVMSRSARKFVKKLIQPFRRSSSQQASIQVDDARSSTIRSKLTGVL